MNYLKMITLKKMTKETKPIAVQDEKIKSMITALSPLQAKLVAGIAIYYESEISRLHDAAELLIAENERRKNGK